MDSIDLETKNGVNCVTRWADRANDDFQRAQKVGSAPSEYKPKREAAGPAIAKPPAGAASPGLGS
jgi:hypothetical protein